MLGVCKLAWGQVVGAKGGNAGVTTDLHVAKRSHCTAPWAVQHPSITVHPVSQWVGVKRLEEKQRAAEMLLSVDRRG